MKKTENVMKKRKKRIEEIRLGTENEFVIFFSNMKIENFQTAIFIKMLINCALSFQIYQ